MGDLDRLSRFLAKLLRHDAQSRGLDISAEGYVDIDDILSQPEARRFTASDVQKVVEKDRKGRFKIRTQYGAMQIKATQAHSMQLEHAEAEMTPINHYSEARVVLHGTKRVNWPSIKANGLSRRRRAHIHFAAGEKVQSGKQTFYLIDEAECSGKGANCVASLVHHFFQYFGHGEKSAAVHFDNCCGQNKNNVILWYSMWRVFQGFPPNCDMVIEINMESALKDGLKFYKSENGVILCAGNSAGVIPFRHFKRAYDLRTHERID